MTTFERLLIKVLLAYYRLAADVAYSYGRISDKGHESAESITTKLVKEVNGD